MTKSKQSSGECLFCSRVMTKNGLGKHFKACPKRQEMIATAKSQHQSSEEIYHLQVQDSWSNDFWLHLEMPGKATLDDLDYYLRAIWLECCGHLSQFSMGGRKGKEIPMDKKISQIFKPKMELTHIYDFGTSSKTLIKAINIRQGPPLTERPIYLMARNQIPPADCVECGEPAGWLCEECLIEEGNWAAFCEKHAEEHPHDNYGDPIPLINSPRFGICGYDGPAEPPY